MGVGKSGGDIERGVTQRVWWMLKSRDEEPDEGDSRNK